MALVALAIVAAFAAGFLTQQFVTPPATADHDEFSGDAIVRIGAMRTESSAVQVALQQRLAVPGKYGLGDEWSTTHIPTASFLPEDAPVGV